MARKKTRRLNSLNSLTGSWQTRRLNSLNNLKPVTALASTGRLRRATLDWDVGTAGIALLKQLKQLKQFSAKQRKQVLDAESETAKSSRRSNP